MFSSRLPRLASNRFSQTVSRLRAAERPLLDLTETNPTRVGLTVDAAALAALGDAAGIRYAPDPRGLDTARAAIAARIGAIDPGQIVLSASTSEAYAWIFKLLCDPGDDVLVPRPSYPLFDLLTGLEGVRAVPYALRHHGVWSIDRASIDAALTARSRAILVVSPNNPTGSLVRAADRGWLVRLAAEADLALVSDEVFADYPLQPAPDAVSLAGETGALSFTLGGLSKSAGLPQMKLAWTIVSGPPSLAADARHRLELIADTYLSVSTPVQLAAGALLDAGLTVRAAIARRTAQNLVLLRDRIGVSRGVSLLEPEAGWTAVIRADGATEDETLAVTLLEEDGVIVHPGYFYDFPHDGYWVVSLLPEPAVFRDGIARLVRRLGGDGA
jgi:aspartate/methionine/tyrosine aminotransferase